MLNCDTRNYLQVKDNFLVILDHTLNDWTLHYMNAKFMLVVIIVGTIRCEFIRTIDNCTRSSDDRMSITFLQVNILDLRIISFHY